MIAMRHWFVCFGNTTCVLALALPSYSQTYLTAESNLTAPPFVASNLHRFDGESDLFAVGAAPDSAFQGVTLLNGVVLAADLREGVIQRFTLDGTLLAPFATVANPTFLESDSGGNVYTTQFSLGPAVAARFDSLGNETGTFTSPSAAEFAGIDADASGNVYVATRSSTLEKFAPDGAFLSSLPINARPLDISIDEQGLRMFLADESSSLAGIQVYDLSSGSPTFSHSIPTPVDSVIHGVHYEPELDVVFAVDSGVLSGNARGLQLSIDGNVVATYFPAGSVAAFDIVHRVPEPASCALVLCGALASLRRGRRVFAATTLVHRCSVDSLGRSVALNLVPWCVRLS